VFGQIFQTPMQEFLPFLTIGMVFWTFIATVVTEGATGFISAESIIKQLPIPLFVHIMRMIWRNLLIFFHNLVIFPIVLLVVGKSIGWIALMSIPGLALNVLNLGWIVLLLAMICARYRDLTPVMWIPSLLRSRMYLLDMNPFYHLLEITRGPLLGQTPATTSWLVAAGMAVIGWIVALLVFGRYRRRIAYWL
jgi:ABC-type polysaccharide/polyol phosphate export permease